jgi:hypothetical protein
LLAVPVDGVGHQKDLRGIILPNAKPLSDHPYEIVDLIVSVTDQAHKGARKNQRRRSAGGPDDVFCELITGYISALLQPEARLSHHPRER